jgi:putative ABC transport system permease protein
VYDNLAWEIVGVVGDVRSHGLQRPAQSIVYRAVPQDGWRNATLVVRTSGEPLALAETVRKAILSLDPSQPVANVRALTEVVARSLGDRRLTAMLLGVFALAAVSLAAIGLYGVIAFAVTQRTREFGIRVALGATKGDVLGLVLRRGLLLAGIGIACGVAGSFGLTRLLARFLYEVKPTDPITFATVSALLLAVALFASWFPARRAAKVDPMVALRHD